MTLLLGGALRFTEYDYFQEQIVKFIVMKRGGSASTERDREFTDWKMSGRAAVTAPRESSSQALMALSLAVSSRCTRLADSRLIVPMSLSSANMRETVSRVRPK